MLNKYLLAFEYIKMGEKLSWSLEGRIVVAPLSVEHIC